MHLRTSALVLLACVVAVAAGPAAADPVPLAGTIDLPCSGSTLHQHTTWYLPAGRYQVVC